MSQFNQNYSYNFNKDPYIFVNPPKKFSDFQILEKLGEGAHGCCYKVQHIATGRIYAIKTIKQEHFKNNETDPVRRKRREYDISDSEKDYFREKLILYDLTRRNYPYIVKLYADFEDENNRYLVMELSLGRKLDSLVGSPQNNGYLDQKFIIDILTQLLEILKYLHDTCHIVHRDIKPDNITIGNDNKIKLLDFGLAVYLVNPNNNNKTLISCKSKKGALRYVAPEILFVNAPRQYDYKIDIYSLGFTIFNLMNPPCGKNFPIETIRNNGNIERVNNNINIENSPYDSWLVEFVQILYENDPTKRPSAADALGLLKGLQTNPKMTEIYNKLKIKRKNTTNIQNLNFIVRGNTPNNNVAMSNISNNFNNNIPMINNTSMSAQQINTNNNFALNNNLNRMNSSGFQQQKQGAEEFLQPNSGSENKILSSMKCILRLFYRLDIINFMKAQIHSIYTNCQFDYKELFMYHYYEMLEIVEKWEKGQINKADYDQMVSNFIRYIIFNNSSGITGARPIILLFMMASIFKDEFQQYFKNIYTNTIFDDIINLNFYPLNSILPLNIPNVYNSIKNTILSFKDKYKSPFVDNFCFILLNLSRCPRCGNLFGIKETHIGQFLQLDVPNPQNNIINLVNNYFTPKIFTSTRVCQYCKSTGQKAIQNVILNLPNYLFLEFEDKNLVYFSHQITIPLYNGKYQSYQYVASIYKRRTSTLTDFFAVIKTGNGYVLCLEDNIQQCPEATVNSPCPSLALYKKI